MNKRFYVYITRQIYTIKYMLAALREATYDNAEVNFEKVLFEVIDALNDFEIIFERINGNKGD